MEHRASYTLPRRHHALWVLVLSSIMMFACGDGRDDTLPPPPVTGTGSPVTNTGPPVTNTGPPVTNTGPPVTDTEPPVDPPKLALTLEGRCTLVQNTFSDVDQYPYQIGFEVKVRNTGGPYTSPTVSFKTTSQPPLTGPSSDITAGYKDGGVYNIGHRIPRADLGKTGIIEIETVGTTRGLKVAIPTSGSDVPCALT